MKLTEKTKKYLVLGGGAVLCVGLLIAISLQFGKAPAGEDKLPEESPAATELAVDSSIPASGSTEESTEEKEVVILPNTDAAEGTDTGQSVDTRPAQTDQTEQSIQPEVTKPAEPEETVISDPTQKPDGTKVETPPVPVEHEEVVTPAETTAAPGEPQGGETQDGKVYLPGFGWVTDTGSSGTTADDMYENGNKIGEMGN
nr:DUF6550 family protein [uncultured Eisenbergiella sp.]